MILYVLQKRGKKTLKGGGVFRKIFKNLVKESDDEEDDNGDVNNASLDEAHPAPKKRTRTKKGWFFF